MKKIIFTIAILFLTLGLMSCGKVKSEDLTVSVVNETIENEMITVDVVVPIELTTAEQINEIAMNVASQTYEKYFDTIGSDTYTMKLSFYMSSTDYDNQSATYGYIVFSINQSIENPGLQVTENHLTYVMSKA